MIYNNDLTETYMFTTDNKYGGNGGEGSIF